MWRQHDNFALLGSPADSFMHHGFVCHGSQGVWKKRVLKLLAEAWASFETNLEVCTLTTSCRETNNNKRHDFTTDPTDRPTHPPLIPSSCKIWFILACETDSWGTIHHYFWNKWTVHFVDPLMNVVWVKCQAIQMTKCVDVRMQVLFRFDLQSMHFGAIIRQIQR